MPAALERLRLRLAYGRAPPAGRRGADALERMGYRRVPTVTEVAEFSVRGGILDVYGFGMAAPARIEWWGDDVSSIRGFDLTTQRSLQELSEITVLPIDARRGSAGRSGDQRRPRRRTPSARRARCSNSFPPTPSSSRRPPAPTRTRCSAPGTRRASSRGGPAAGRGCARAGRTSWRRRSVARRGSRASRGSCCGTSGCDLQFGFFPPEKIDRDLNRLRACSPARRRPSFCATTRASSSGSRSCWRRARAASRATLAIGALDGGFVMPTLRVLTDHEIFRRARRLRRPRRYRQAAPSAATGALAEGDYVVHLEHGIGIYRGIQTITGGRVDARGRHRRVRGRRPAQRAALPPRPGRALPRGRRGRRPAPAAAPPAGRLVAGQRVREKTRQAIKQMAAELLELYARRTVSRRLRLPARQPLAAGARVELPLRGHARPAEGHRGGEGRHGAAAAHGPAARGRRGLRQDRDRRARGVQGGAGRQAGRGAGADDDPGGAARPRPSCERLADFPVDDRGALPLPHGQGAEGGARSGSRRGRSTSSSAPTACCRRTSLFKDLGLLVVDEEHRFGVKHKERLKALRLSVDVLTLTATPIPRTLHLSLAGLRDLTLIETPPRDRSPILTFVEPWDDGAARGGVRARARPRRAGVLRPQPDRDDRHRSPRGSGRSRRARGSAWRTARWRPRSWRR